VHVIFLLDVALIDNIRQTSDMLELLYANTQTEEVVRRKLVVVPDLHHQDRRLSVLGLVQTPEVFFAFDDEALLGRDVLERKYESPVKVAVTV